MLQPFIRALYGDRVIPVTDGSGRRQTGGWMGSRAKVNGFEFSPLLLLVSRQEQLDEFKDGQTGRRID